jgi:hypothetical protein
VQYKICLLLLDLEMEDVVPELFRMLLSQRITRCGAAITPLPSRVSALSCPTAWAVGRGCCERSEGEGGGVSAVRATDTTRAQKCSRCVSLEPSRLWSNEEGKFNSS